MTDSCHTLILAPAWEELRIVGHRLGLRRRGYTFRGDWSGRRLHAALVGVGPEQAGEQAARLVSTLEPSRVWLVGLCGALNPDLPAEGVHEPRWLMRPQPDRLTPGLTALASVSTRVLSDAVPDGPTLLSVAQTAATQAEKAAWRRLTRADLIDTESFAVAAVLAAHPGVRFWVLRAVSDEAERDLPPQVHTLLSPQGLTVLPRVLGYVTRRPQQVPALIALGRRTHRAMAALADRLAAHLQESAP